MSAFNQNSKTNIPHLSIIHGKFTVGASGAPTLVTTSLASYGIQSITRVSAGLYDIVLGTVKGLDYYKDIIFFDAFYQFTTSIPTVFTKPNAISFNPATSKLSIQFTKPTVSAGPVVSAVAADPDNGATVCLELVMKVM